MALSPELLAQAHAAAAPAQHIMAGHQPVFDITRETNEAKHNSTTLTPHQQTEYERIMALYRNAGEMGPGNSAEEKANHRALVAALKNLSAVDEVDRTAIIGRLLYQGAHSSPSKGNGLIVDVLAYAPSAGEILFTNQAGQPVPFKDILSKISPEMEDGINLRWSAIEYQMNKLPVEHAAHKQNTGHQR